MTDGEPLSRIFERLIRHGGPITLQHYMGESNLHYYNSRDPLGSAGDFVTAPEISQMFGELIGLCLADVWIRAGRPEPVHYVELGPGRGTLAADALRAAAKYGLNPSVHFVEGSIALKAIQLDAHPNAYWHDSIAGIPSQGSLLIVANEFLDALPVRQLVKTAEGWRERVVDFQHGMFLPVAGSAPMDAAVPQLYRKADVGSILETCPGAAAVVYEIAGRLTAQGGVALMIDYGHAEPRFGSSLQAVRNHARIDPFAEPGSADLTAHVDFSALRLIAESREAVWLGTVEQGPFLRALGIEARAEQLINAAPHHADDVTASMARLINEGQMGALFKVMGLSAPDWPVAAGF